MSHVKNRPTSKPQFNTQPHLLIKSTHMTTSLHIHHTCNTVISDSKCKVKSIPFTPQPHPHYTPNAKSKDISSDPTVVNPSINAKPSTPAQPALYRISNARVKRKNKKKTPCNAKPSHHTDTTPLLAHHHPTAASSPPRHRATTSSLCRGLSLRLLICVFLNVSSFRVSRLRAGLGVVPLLPRLLTGLPGRDVAIS